MREIKFRGKGINGEWHKGLLSISQGKPGQPEKGYYISNEAGMPWAYQVRPETIGQLIATIDGQEFYEGDIDYGNKVQRIKLLRENLFVLKDDCKIDYKNGKKTLRGRC
jgi:hypothetical protein